MPWKSKCSKEQRWEFVRQWLRHKIGIAQLCRGWQISRKTAYKWIARFQERGRSGLADQARIARRVHNRPAPRWLKRIRRWRVRHPYWGAAKLRWALQRRFGRQGLSSEAAIHRWLKGWGLTRRRWRPRHKGPRLERPPLTLPQNCNDVLTVDFKEWCLTGDGVRVDPLTVRDLYSRYVLAFVLLHRPSLP